MSFLSSTKFLLSEIYLRPADVTRDAGDAVDRKTRLIAGLIDAGVILAILLVLFFALWIIGLMPTGIIGSVVATVVAAVSFLGLNYKLLDANGQTIGKKIQETKIVCSEGFPVATDDLIVKRYLPIFAVAMIPWIGPLLLLGNFLMVLRSNQLCGHDEIAKTKVVKS
jgi:uncharacterized RDD family membrane protein YckC